MIPPTTPESSRHWPSESGSPKPAIVTRRAAVAPVIVSGRIFSPLARVMISRPCSMMAAIRSRRTPMMSRPLPTAVIVDVHNTVACEPIVLCGDDAQKREWLPRMAAGEVTGAFALTEPSSGSDAAALTTSARRYGDEYVLNGTKVFITNIGEAGL